MQLFPVIASSIILSLIFAPLGCVNIWRRYVYFADGLSHAVILASGISVVCSLDLSYAGLILSFFFAFAVFKFKKKTGPGESIIIISNFMVALSLILSYAAPRPFNIGSLLFGELLWVGTGDVIILSLIALACFLFFFLFYRQIILISLNEDMAKVSGAKTERIELFFLFLLSLSVFSAVKIVGALLVASISIVPASCAKFFSKSPGGMILNSVFISLAVNCAGLFFSFRFDLPVSASILVTGSILYFLLVFFFSLGSRKKV